MRCLRSFPIPLGRRGVPCMERTLAGSPKTHGRPHHPAKRDPNLLLGRCPYGPPRRRLEERGRVLLEEVVSCPGYGERGEGEDHAEHGVVEQDEDSEHAEGMRSVMHPAVERIAMGLVVVGKKPAALQVLSHTGPLRFSQAPLRFARSARCPCSPSSPPQTRPRGTPRLLQADALCREGR